MYHLKHPDGDPPSLQEYKLFWRSCLSFFYFFSDSGEVVTLEIPPRTLVAIPMKLLNRPIKHGVWDPEHEGLQVRLRGGLRLSSGF